MKASYSILVSALVAGFGCASEGAGNNAPAFDPGNDARGDSQNAQDVEVEQEFDFAQPAVVGTDVFVPNESLNSVAIIDSRSLAIRTVPVGFKPTLVAGPTIPGDGSRIWVLNEGSSSVSIIDPSSLAVSTAGVLRGANAMAVSPDGRWALTWVDGALLEAAGTARDLSAVTLIRGDGSAYQLATGFRVERVVFAGDSALVLTDDGVSVVRESEISADALVAPIAVLPPEMQQLDRSDREVVLDPAGEWSVARVQTYAGVVLTELATGVQWSAAFASVPTDIDWIPGDTPRILVMLRASGLAAVATVPEGLVALGAITQPAADMGSDAGSDVGLDAGADVGLDAGADMSVDAGADMPVDLGIDGGDVAVDMAPPMTTMPVAGVWLLPLAQSGLGAAEVAPEANNALLFSTIEEERRAVLLDLTDLSQRSLFFEKGVRGALANADGTRYVVLHSREPGEIPAGASPADPEFIARSWGLSVVDVDTTATRLILTEREPGATTIWAGEPSERVYMIFAGEGSGDTLRDVLRVDLDSFSTQTFRVPSLPEGVGRIDAAGRIYINQKHAQGRLTFVDVTTDHRQTVTGYQLNAGID